MEATSTAASVPFNLGVFFVVSSTPHAVVVVVVVVAMVPDVVPVSGCHGHFTAIPYRVLPQKKSAPIAVDWEPGISPV